MTGNLARRFGDRERQRLIKLFRLLGTGNAHEREVACSMMDALLREHGRAWADLIRLLAAGIAGSLRMHGSSYCADYGTASQPSNIRALRAAGGGTV
jgi:hypothetical protein